MVYARLLEDSSCVHGETRITYLAGAFQVCLRGCPLELLDLGEDALDAHRLPAWCLSSTSLHGRARGHAMRETPSTAYFCLVSSTSTR